MQPFLTDMIGRGWLAKNVARAATNAVGKDREIHAIGWKTLEYHPAAKPRFASLETVRKIEPLAERLKALVALDDKAGRFLWQLLSSHVVYAAYMVPEISDRIVEVDQAMRWGYANSVGPFELWDALGFEATAQRIESEGRPLPENVQRMRSAGAQSFYRSADANHQPKTEYFDLAGSGFAPLAPRPRHHRSHRAQARPRVVKKNAGASLIDLGDGVLCCEFHSKMNTIGDDILQMVRAGLAELETNFDAMVLANQGENFSVGANLVMGSPRRPGRRMGRTGSRSQSFPAGQHGPQIRAKAGGRRPVRHVSRRRLRTPHALHPHSGFSGTLHGPVETGVGVIPAGGGCKELLTRSRDIKKLFEQIGFGKVSTSAAEARQFKYLRDSDRISMNPERLIDDAKQTALSLVPTYAPGAPRTDIIVSGQEGFALMKMGVWMARQGGYISDYDAVVGEKLAHVLSGGRVTGTPQVSEQYLLDLEREAFLSLCGRRETQARMQHMLKTGKPLRN